MKKIFYWKRIIQAYVLRSNSQLTFWHESPEVNIDFKTDDIGSYYMKFHQKADYDSSCDMDGIPMLDYKGAIGPQYNPIAIAQWGLGNYNLWISTGSKKRYIKFIKSANWLVENLEENEFGLKVWMHKFDFEYRDTLKSPWYSGLAQGQGLSLLVRAYKETNEKEYENAINEVIKSFKIDIYNGGVNYVDANGFEWIEEYIVNPPTHILNGFIWALWGIYDYNILKKDNSSEKMIKKYLETLENNLENYDLRYWSKYELSNKSIPMIASPFYHKLHIIQLDIMYRLTKKNIFYNYQKKWITQQKNSIYKFMSIVHKSIFKVLYY